MLNSLLFVLIVMIFSFSCQTNKSNHAKTVQPTITKSVIAQSAISKAIERYKNHPDIECRTKMTEWINSGKVLIATDVRLPSGVASASLNGGDIPALLLSPDYFEVDDTPSYEADKNSTLYHEFIHIRDHITGKNIMVDSRLSLPEKERARRAWNAEWSAVQAEWVFLKRIGAEKKFIYDPSVLKTKTEKQALLDMLYESLQRTYPPSQVKLFLPIWTEMYKRESAISVKPSLQSLAFFFCSYILKLCLNYQKYKPLSAS